MTIAYQLILDGAKHTARAVHEGRAIDVVTGWDVNSNKWPVHVYVADSAGHLQKVEGTTIKADLRDEAIAAGLALAIHSIDQGGT